jgi:general secretion pathway protein L
MTIAFLMWWRAQLEDLLPAVLRRSDAEIGSSVWLALVSPLEVTPAVIEVSGPRRRGRPPERVALDGEGQARLRDLLAGGGPPKLRLRQGVLLERAVVLPLIAERAPERVLSYEFDRLTPFAAADALWSCEVTRRDSARGRLHLRLTLVSRTAVAPLLETLRAAGALPGSIEAPDGRPGGRWRRIRLQPLQPRRRPLGIVAWVACTLLAVAAVFEPFWRQSIALAQTDDELAVLAPTVAEATALRRQLALEAQGGDILAAERVRLGDALQTVAIVTEALPDDTWLTDLSLRQRKLKLSGQSATAVQLIARLAADRAFRNPAFTAPVTRGNGGQTEMFTIDTELAP